MALLIKTSDIRERIKEVVHEQMEIKGVSQAAFARSIGVSPPLLSMIMSLKTTPSILTLIEVLDACGYGIAIRPLTEIDTHLILTEPAG